MQVASIGLRGDDTLIATLSPTRAGRFTVIGAYVPIMGDLQTFARIPINVASAGDDLCNNH